MIGSALKLKPTVALAVLGFLGLLTVTGSAQVLEQLEREFAAIAANASESCVRVDVVKHVSIKQISIPIQDGQKGTAHLKENAGEMDILHSLSGVLIDDEGYVVTLGDALEEISRVRVVVYQGGEQKRYKAEVIGFDLDSNVGLLKIKNPPALKALPLGDSDTLKQGAFVFGVGYTINMGPSPSFTVGNVNATDRIFSLKRKQEAGRKLIQTSLSIKPGETGGALINSASQVVGVLLTSYSGADRRKEMFFSSGYTLAIPINRIKEEVEWIIAKHAEGSSVSSTAKAVKSKEKPWLGLTASEITDTALRNQLKLTEGGVLISDIFPNDPAEKAGILKNDVLVQWDGIVVKSLEHLRELVGKVKSGEKVLLVLIRQGEEVKVALDVGKY